MIYVGGRALTDPSRPGIHGIGFDVSDVIPGLTSAGEHLLDNVGSGILHYLGVGDKPPPAAAPPPPAAPVWPWVVGGGLAVGALGFALLRKRKRR